MADGIQQVTEVASGFIPKFTTVGSGAFNVFSWILLTLIIISIMGVSAFMFMRWMKYNKKIIIFEKIGNNFEPTRKDKASEVKFSTGGDTIFYLLKHKKYIPNPSIQTGRRTYWYFIREDGEWINFGMEDLDHKSRKLGARFLDKEMRYARTQIQKGLKERYDKPGFWQQYGLLIFSLGYIAMIGVMTWLLFDKWLDLASATNAGVETAGVVMEKINQILGSMDNVCSGGSGIK